MGFMSRKNATSYTESDPSAFELDWALFMRDVLPNHRLGFQRLVMQYETTSKGKYDGELTALFNPNRITTSTQVGWSQRQTAAPDSPIRELDIHSGAYQPTTLSLELFFDTTTPAGLERTELTGGTLLKAAALVSSPFAYYPTATPDGTSVLNQTAAVYQLTQPAIELHRPPICRLWWGRYLLIQGVLSGLQQEFTRFKEDGTPIRATLRCTFTRVIADAISIRATEFHSADVHKEWVVRRGDTLPGIAAEIYGDASQWIAIARANGIANPRRLTPGQVLRIPRIDGGRR